MSKEINLQEDVFVPFKLNYFEVKELAFVSLMYRVVGVSNENTVVPKEMFYSVKEETPISGKDYPVQAYTTAR